MSVKLSPIIAGTMNWGIWDKNLSTTEMSHLINICIENKITTFDHADIYGGYTTEAAFGKALTESKVDRKNMQLITKCGIEHISENRPKNVVKHYDYSAAYIIWSVENSLKNLQTDYLDALLLHRPSPLMQADEIAEAVEKLKENNYQIVAIEQAESSVSLIDFNPTNDKKYALFFGNEVNGVSEEVMQQIDTCIEIPQFGTKHSLNISVCIGVVLWDFMYKVGIAQLKGASVHIINLSAFIPFINGFCN